MNTCNKCPFLEIEVDGKNTINGICKKTNKVLVYSVLATDNIPTPCNCPLDKKETTVVTRPTIRTIYDIQPQIAWEDIKKGDIYHLPSSGTYTVRKELTVEEKTSNYVKCSYIANVLTQTKSWLYIYNMSKEHRLMVKPKKITL